MQTCIVHLTRASLRWVNYAEDLSRGFRALKVWMALAHAGSRAVGDAVGDNLDCGELSIFCFRYLPRSARAGSRSQADEEELDRLNERIMLALQHAGSSYLSNATINGRFAPRGCMLNYRTTRRDIEILLDDVRRAAEQAIEETR